MAYADFAAIRKAIRERIEGTIATAPRQMTAGRLKGQLYTTLDDAGKRIRALSAPRYEVTIPRVTRSASSPPENGSLGIYDLEVKLRCAYALKAPVVSDDLRDSVRAIAEQDCDRLRQALGFPNVLRQTSAAVATGLRSGQLRFTTYDVLREEFGSGGDKGAGLYETQLTFTGVVVVTMATS